MGDASEDWLEAERRIEEARVSGAEVLDLSRLDIEAVPASVVDLEQVRIIRLKFCQYLFKISALAQLPNLLRLDLSWCKLLSDLSPLASLTDLQILNLHKCVALSDLSPLASLTTLTRLNLHGCKALSDLSPLASLSALQCLNLHGGKALSDLSPLASLSTLQRLYLTKCDALNDLSPLASLTALQHLSLCRYSGLNGLSPLLKLPGLTKLFLMDSNPLCCKPGHSILDAAVNLERLYCNNLDVAPNELASQSGIRGGDNSLPRLKAWRADLDQGQADNHRIKLFVLGNGSAGKTQICRRLNGQAFNPGPPHSECIANKRHELRFAPAANLLSTIRLCPIPT